MLNKKIIWSLILLVALLSVSGVGAADNITGDEINDLVGMEDSIVNDSLSASSKTFTDLNNLLNDNSKWNFELTDDYVFSSSDSAFKEGIPISRSISIQGNGHTINANGQARIFNLTNYVTFYNINFINANSPSGSAITGTNYAAIDCRFTNNHADTSGGAMYGGYAKNCIFQGNTADRWGGAVYGANIEQCTLISNSANEGGAIYNVYATECMFMRNTANLYGGAMYGSSVGKSVFTGNSAKVYGGAVFNAYIVNCNFTNNSASYGGALGGESYSALNCILKDNYAENGGAMFGGTATDCIFISNNAHNGGAKYSGSAVNCLFDNNHAVNVGGAIMETYAVSCNFTYNSAIKGGAMYQNSAVTCIFTGNNAVNGGAMFNAHSDTSKFYNNSATQGGAIDEGGAESSDFRYNHAVNGGAIANSDALACTFASNTADEYGGAVYKTSARRCLFSKNTAQYGGALAYGSASECSFRNNVAKVTGGVRFESYVADTVECEGNLPTYTLYVSDFSGIEGFGGDLSIKLYDNPNYQVTGVNATIKVYNSKNKLIGTYLSEVGYNWFVNFDAGKYKAVISIGDDVYELDPVKININIQKSSFIYVVNVVTNYQAGKVLLVNLHDSAGTVLKYAKVTVKLNGVTKAYITDDNGQVMVPTKTLAPGTYAAYIEYAGSDVYIESSASAKITVKKLTPKLTAAKATLKLSDKIKKYTVTLKNNKNVVMKSAKLTVKVGGKTYSVKTNAKGQAIFKLTKLTKKGKYSAVVAYSGSSIYNGVKKTVVITVK